MDDLQSMFHTIVFQACTTVYLCIFTSWVFIFIVLLLHLILHTAQPAAVTTVAMETCGVSKEKALNGREKRLRVGGEGQEIEKGEKSS